ncbi:MAG: AAA family ATPase [Verrucomicrobiota bacterium]
MNPDSVSHASTHLQSHVIQPLKETFVGKDEIIDLLGVCVVARENLFLHGPPGTAKSALVQSFSQLIAGQAFDYLLSRFTEPNELFGPFDIRKLREGDLVTNTEGMLPEADIVFLDELLNANSAILNSLLMALNERIFRRGRETRKIPALFFVGASNHLPEEDTLRALFDRFLLRVRCEAVPDDQLEDVLVAGWNLEKKLAAPDSPLSADNLREFQKLIPLVDLDAVRHEHIDLVLKLRHAGVEVSDRRAVRLQRIVAASALVSGRMEARLSDLWIFRHIWDRQEQIGVIESLVAATLSRSEPEAGDHPQAHAEQAPDPEVIMQQLTELAERASNDSSSAALTDDLRAISNRMEWIPAGAARETLVEKRDALWQQLETDQIC